MIKAISFDLGNTLLRHDNLNWQKLEKAGFLSHGKIFEKHGLTRPTLRQWTDAYYRDFEIMRRISDDYLLEISVERIFAGLHREFDLPATITNESILHAFFLPLVSARQLIPGALQAIRSLRDLPLNLGVISNSVTPSAYGRRALANLGILNDFDFVLYSSECLYIKPHPRMFEMALHRWGIRAGSVLHVGDQLHRDIQGASSVGMKTVWVNSSREKIRHKRFKPDFEISDISELPSLLESLR